jgi:hypothetical protein
MKGEMANLERLASRNPVRSNYVPSQSKLSPPVRSIGVIDRDFDGIAYPFHSRCPDRENESRGDDDLDTLPSI